MNPRFSFGLDVLKAETRDGRPILTIYATDTARDKEDDRCSMEGLLGMAEQIKAGKTDLLNSHFDAIGFGRGVDARVVDAAQFHPELVGHQALLADIELDFEFPQAKAIFESAQRKETKYKFSIGGKLNRKNPKCVTWERGKRVFNDLNLDHITVAREITEANGRTGIASAVFKTLGMTATDEKELQGAQAPYTLRDLSKRYGLPLGDDVVQKEITSAYFQGDTVEAGTPAHVHGWTAELDGRSGTLIGMTYQYSLGERHRHMIDLMGDDPTMTSLASRGADVHSHGLGIATVKQITQSDFEKILADLSTDDPTAAKLLSGMKSMETAKTSPSVTDPATSVSPSVAPVAPASAVQTPASSVLPDEGMGLLKGFAEAAAKVFGRKVEAASLPADLDIFAAHITSDFTKKGGDVNALAKSAVGLLQRVAGVQVDHDSLSVRTAKLFEVIESAGMGKILSAPVAEITPAAKVEGEVETKPAATATPETKETETEMKKEEIVELGKAIGTELGKSIGQEVAASLVEQFRKDGLLPTAAKTEPAAPATTPEVAPVAPAAAPEAPKAAPAPVTAPVTEPAKADVVGETVQKVVAGLDTVTKTLSDITDRLTAMESKPGARKSTDGQDGNVTSKKGIFSGAMTRAPGGK